MSEKFENAKEVRDVNQAFDPELRTAQADWENYLDSRPYEDGNGSIHNPENGRFAADPNSASEDDYYNRMQDESETEGQFSGASLKDIAEMVRDAKARGDKTGELDARAAFDDKFMAVAEKYDWQGVVENADGTKTDRNAIADRKLAYFESIMDAEDEAEQSSVEASDNVESSNTEYSDTLDEEPQYEEQAASDATDFESEPENASDKADTEQEKYDIDKDFEESKARADERAKELDAAANERIHGTDQAKEDKALLADSENNKSEDGSDKSEDSESSNDQEAEEADVSDEEKYDTGAQDLEDLDVVEDDDDRRVGKKYVPRHRGNNRLGFIKRKLNGASAHGGARLNVLRNDLEKSRRNRIIGLLTGVAIGGFLVWQGLQPDGADAVAGGGGGGGNAPSPSPDIPSTDVPTTLDIPTEGGDSTPGNFPSGVVYEDGTGGHELMKTMNMDAATWNKHEDEFARQFPGITYPMDDGHIGLIDRNQATDVSKLPQAAVDFWRSRS